MSNERQPTVEELQARIQELELKLKNQNNEEEEIKQFKEDINSMIDNALSMQVTFEYILDLISDYTCGKAREIAHVKHNRLRGLRSYTRGGDRVADDIREAAGYDRDRYSRRGGGDRRG